MSEGVPAAVGGQIFQNGGGADAVAVAVERRAEGANAETMIDHCHNAASYAALGGDADFDGERSAAVIQAAGEHQGFGDPDGRGGDYTLARGAVDTAVGHCGGEAGQIAGADIDRAGTGIKAERLIQIANQ